MKLLLIAARNVLKNKTRSSILGGAMAAVTALMIVMLSVASGVQKTILEGATALFSGHVNVAGFYKLSQSSSAPVVTRAKEILTITRELVPEADVIVDRLKGYGKIISESSSITVPFSGVNMANETSILGRLALASKSDYIENYQPKEGEPETEGSLQDMQKPGSIVLFASQAKKLKIRVGDSVTVSMPTYRNMSNTRDVRVVAILRNMGLLSSFAAFIHHDDLREIYQLAGDTTGQVQIYLKSVDDVAKVEDRLRRALPERGFTLMEKEAQPYWMKFDRVSGESWTGQKLDITTWQDETAFAKWVLDILRTLTFLLAVTLMSIVALGLMNALWISIRERTSEIGTLRAIGLQRRSVLFMSIMEALILSAGGATTGITLGAIISGLLNLIEIPVKSEAFQMFLMADVLSVNVDPRDLITAFVTIIFFMTLGAIYPSYRAAKMNPITAINHVK